MPGVIIGAVLFALILFMIILTFAVRYKKCPSDHIMVVYGKIAGDTSARCIHGGAQFVWPFIQDYRYLSLRPMQIDINLTGALSRQNIRINTPSTYTIGISTEAEIMQNAAERLLSMSPKDIEDTAREIIFGQQRLVIASMDIEEINANRDSFLHNIKENVEIELNKIGLRLINVNITDITDEEAYLESLGKKAAAEVTNRAKVQVAEQMRIGETGRAEAEKEQRIAIANAEALAATGEANAMRERRVAVSAAEAGAAKGEAEADQLRRVAVAAAEAEARKGEADSNRDQRITIMAHDATAVDGENQSRMSVAKSDAERKEIEEDARRRAEAALQQADARIQAARFEAEEEMEVKRASMVKQREIAERVVPAEIEKLQREIAAEADAEVARRRAKGEADATYADLEAHARGLYEGLKAKAQGFDEIVKGCGGSADSAATMLMVEKIESLVATQVEAIKNLKIDKVTVWDNLGGGGNGKGATADFVSSLVTSLPPLHEIAKNAGVDLPEYLGKIADDPKALEALAKQAKPAKSAKPIPPVATDGADGA